MVEGAGLRRRQVPHLLGPLEADRMAWMSAVANARLSFRLRGNDMYCIGFLSIRKRCAVQQDRSVVNRGAASRGSTTHRGGGTGPLLPPWLSQRDHGRLGGRTGHQQENALRALPKQDRAARGRARR